MNFEAEAERAKIEAEKEMESERRKQEFELRKLEMEQDLRLREVQGVTGQLVEKSHRKLPTHGVVNLQMLCFFEINILRHVLSCFSVIFLF